MTDSPAPEPLVRTPDVLRYEAALRGNAAHLAGLDAQWRMIDGSSRD